MRIPGSWAAVFLVTVLAGCADRDRPAGADGDLLALPGALDFQRIAMHGQAELDVTLRNVGRGKLGLGDVWVETSDGPYAAALEEDGPRALLAGGKVHVRVQFSPEREGPQEAVLAIRTDSRRVSLVRLPLTGIGVDARAALTDEVLDFGRIEVQAEKTRMLALENVSDLPVDVTFLPEGDDADEFSAPQKITLGDHEKRAVEVVFRPQVVGVKHATLTVVPCSGCAPRTVRLVAEGLDRAVVAEPWTVDFGPVPIDRVANDRARLHNISTEPVTITGEALTPGTDASFTIDPAAFPITLAPDERRDFPIHYSPGHMGAATGKVAFSVESVRNPQAVLQLSGWGGAAELCVSPWSYYFDTVPVGAKVSTVVTLRNCGTGNLGPLEITGATFGGDGVPGEDEFKIQSPAFPLTLQAGESTQIRVFFEPTRAGIGGGYLRVRTTAFGSQEIRIGFNGEARESTSCTIQLTPEALDFGTVRPGYGAVLGVKVMNRGADLCAVKNIRLADDANGRFVMPGGELDGAVLEPGDGFAFQVAFLSPQAPSGGHTGVLQVESGDPARPRTLIPLKANSQESCLIATPNYLDFGFSRPDCPPEPRSVRFSNQCKDPVEVRSLAIGAGTTDGEFTLESVSTGFPTTLPPGGSFSAEVRYAATVPGMNLSPLYADASGIAAPLMVTLLGESNLHDTQTDRFVQQDGAKVDVLFVVDNTASMVEERPRLVAAMPSFASAALERGVELNVAVTTTGIDAASDACPGGAQGGEAGRFFPADNSRERLLTQDTVDLASKLQANAQVGECAFVEQGLEAMRRALTDPLITHADDPRTPLPADGNRGFLRPGAALAVVFVGDEDDHSPDSVATYVDFLQTVKGAYQPQRSVIYAIAPTEQSCATAGGTGTRYAEAARATGGEVTPICAADYGPALRDVAMKAFSPQLKFPLSGHPATGTIAVSVGGVPVTSGWHYDGTANAVIFDEAPPAGVEITVTYKKICGT